MPTTNPQVDAYIQKAPEYAKPILKTLRERVHANVPGLEEAVKWNAPFFLSDGQIFCSMVAFKAHVKFNLWSSADFRNARPEQFDVSSVEALPPVNAFAAMVKQAHAELESSGEVAPKKKPAPTAAAAKKASPKKAAAKKSAAPEKKPAAKKAPAKKKSR